LGRTLISATCPRAHGCRCKESERGMFTITGAAKAAIGRGVVTMMRAQKFIMNRCRMTGRSGLNRRAGGERAVGDQVVRGTKSPRERRTLDPDSGQDEFGSSFIWQCTRVQ
jgi:hypothetical protein